MFSRLAYPRIAAIGLLVALATSWATGSDGPQTGAPPFAAMTVHQVDGPVYAMAWGLIDPAHPAGAVACLLENASVLQLAPIRAGWSASLLHVGLTPIHGMIDRPTICIGDVHSGYPGNEIVLDGGKYMTVLYRQPTGSWTHEIVFDSTPYIGAGWGSRVGNADPNRPGEEILHIYEAVLDRSVGRLFREVNGRWQEDIIYDDHVVMDTAIGQFDPMHPGNEIVAVTEAGYTYQLTPPSPPKGGLWPMRLIWNDMPNSGWVVKIADVEPERPGNELVYGTRYNNRILMSYPAAGTAGHELQVLYTGVGGDNYTMYDIAIGNVLPDAPGLEILGVDGTGSVYLVQRIARNNWKGRVIWQTPDGSPLHAIVAGDFLPGRDGDEILVAGQSGTFTMLMVASPADFDRDGDVDADDLAAFVSCYSRPSVPYTGDCSAMDFDGDGDVDQSDFGIFQRCWSGAGIPAPLRCAD